MMRYFETALAVFICMIFASCNNVSPKEQEFLDALNNDKSIPSVYYGLVIPKGNHMVYNENFYNRGANWFQVKNSPEDFEDAHKIKIESPKGLMANTAVIDVDGRPVYMSAVSSRGKIDNCRGCSHCYKKYAAAGLIDYTILEENVGANNLIKAKTQFTLEGLKYKLLPLYTNMVEQNDAEVIVKVADYEFLGISSLAEAGNTATAEVEYYIQYSPFAEALGYKTRKREILTESFEFERLDDKWVVKKKEVKPTEKK